MQSPVFLKNLFQCDYLHSRSFSLYLRETSFISICSHCFLYFSCYHREDLALFSLDTFLLHIAKARWETSTSPKQNNQQTWKKMTKNSIISNSTERNLPCFQTFQPTLEKTPNIFFFSSSFQMLRVYVVIIMQIQAIFCCFSFLSVIYNAKRLHIVFYFINQYTVALKMLLQREPPFQQLLLASPLLFRGTPQLPPCFQVRLNA